MADQTGSDLAVFAALAWSQLKRFAALRRAMRSTGRLTRGPSQSGRPDFACRGLPVLCPPGPTRAALERSEIAAGAVIVADHTALIATSSGTARTDALVAPPGRGRGPRAATSARRPRLLPEAALAIEARYAEPELALGDIARQIATSERQLQRIFAELGASAFRDELTAVRMQHAARLLHDSHMTVGEIARHVGYRQPSQFSKAFRRCYGVTPSAFLRRPD